MGGAWTIHEQLKIQLIIPPLQGGINALLFEKLCNTLLLFVLKTFILPLFFILIFLFHSLCYSADGACILAGGNSRYVCIYEITSHLLLRRFRYDLFNFKFFNDLVTTCDIYIYMCLKLKYILKVPTCFL